MRKARPPHVRDTRESRLLLVLLIAIAFALITVDIRGGEESPVDGARQAAAAVFGPVEDGVAAVVDPVGDAVAAVRDSGDRHDRLATLEKENAALKARLGSDDRNRSRLGQLDKMLKIGRRRTVRHQGRRGHRHRSGPGLLLDGHHRHRRGRRRQARHDRPQRRRTRRPRHHRRPRHLDRAARQRPRLHRRHPDGGQRRTGLRLRAGRPAAARPAPQRQGQGEARATGWSPSARRPTSRSCPAYPSVSCPGSTPRAAT